MLDHPNRLPIEECQQGHAYVLCSRNLLIGVCLRGLDPKEQFSISFVGIREKLGHRYLDTEYHWDCGEPFGTANPLRDLGLVPSDVIANDERLFHWLESAQKQHGIEISDVLPKGRRGLI